VTAETPSRQDAIGPQVTRYELYAPEIATHRRPGQFIIVRIDDGSYGEKALVTIMVDGTGMCGGCRVTVGDESRFVCVDGPEFDGHKVDFDEMMRRQRFYLGQEREAMDLFQKRRSAASIHAVSGDAVSGDAVGGDAVGGEGGASGTKHACRLGPPSAGGAR
jgi:hypothetical protein